MKFYDTNALLELQEKVFEEFFFIASTTLLELEDIKVNRQKDDKIKFDCRKILHLLTENPNKFHVVIFEEIANGFELGDIFNVSDTPDTRICTCARFANDYLKYNDGKWEYSIVTNKFNNNITFVTNDLSCYNIAKYIFKLNVETTNKNIIEDYKGYVEVIMTEEELSDFYQTRKNNWNLVANQYLLIKYPDGSVADKYCWDGNEFQFVKYPTIKSKMFGEVKPYDKDPYQQFALNSMMTNKITMIKGAAGTGKSFLSIGFMLYMLEKGKIDKIVIFANPTPTANAAKLGFLPGTQLEKLTDSSLGNMLGAKLGDKYMIDKLVSENKLDILPMCDIRGFDTSGLNCAVYITEAQNLDISLMKLALQRVGEDSIVIIDGDFSAQVDLSQYAGYNNGMRRLSQVFRGHDFYGEVELKNIYRGRIAQLAEEM